MRRVAELDWPTVGWIVVSGAGTAVGGLALLVIRRPAERLLDTLLGFTAGVMLAATAFSLLVPALERGTLAAVLGGFLLGAGLIMAVDEVLPHVHARFSESGHQTERGTSETRRAVLLLSALTIHNVPEGAAVGVAFAAGGSELGVPLAIAIGVQNVPEGFAAAAPLLKTGSAGRAAGFAALTGAVEPPSALAAFAAFGVASSLLPFGLAFAAGAMLYVIADELIPESHARGYTREASVAVVGGFAVMMALDNAFG
jgi:ZIP family zinc transporter